MDPSQLTARLKAYGADVDGIRTRFDGDAEAYEKCLRALFGLPCLARLRESLAAPERARRSRRRTGSGTKPPIWV